MPQSLSNIIIHVVFSTKDRVPLLHKSLCQELYPYLATTVRELERCECYRVNGVEDHVHLAVRQARTMTIAKLVEKVKVSSSKWIKGQGKELEAFAWQGGYFAGSVNYQDIDKLLAYIDGQEEHHRRVGFQEEYRALLHENGIEFDERYVWD
jgi:putative transposase